MASVIQAAIDGVMLQWVFEESAIDLDACRDQILEMVDPARRDSLRTAAVEAARVREERKMSNQEDTKGHQDDHEHVIDTTGMSEGKRRGAGAGRGLSRDVHWAYPTFAGALFMGQLPWKLIYPFPQLESDRSDEGEAFLERLETFLQGSRRSRRDRPHRRDPRRGHRRGLAEMGAFGIKMPKEYGGLGLSQQYYTRAAMLLGSYCANTAALLSAHQSIGVPQPLLQFGTEEQKQRFLPRLRRGEISAFALTEEGVGSDPARMETTAEPTPDGKYFILNGSKLWCTNGTIAGLLVVMAKTPPKIRKGREINQISAFIVEADAPGVEVVYRCRFMGLKALYNAVIDFKDVKVPRREHHRRRGQGPAGRADDAEHRPPDAARQLRRRHPGLPEDWPATGPTNASSGARRSASTARSPTRSHASPPRCSPSSR